MIQSADDGAPEPQTVLPRMTDGGRDTVVQRQDDAVRLFAF